MIQNLFQGYDQFILWKPVDRGGGKIDKVPCDITGAPSDAHNPAAWMSGVNAQAAASMSGLQVGFVFTDSDPFFFVDIDGALAPTSPPDWSDLSKLILSAFPGCAVEVSHSGAGLHIFGVGSAPDHKCKNIENHIELYTEGRFVALTGIGLQGDSQTDGQAGLNWLVESYFKPGVAGSVADWTTVPCNDWCGPDSDEELLKIAKRSKSAASTFGNKASFIDLYQGNEEKLSECYPSQNGVDPYDRSSADAALASHLAFYTGKNCERIEQIFNSSALGQRGKWTDRSDYRERTILRAVGVCRSVYSNDKYRDPIGPVASSGGTSDGCECRAGSQYLDVSAQLDHFKGHVYVINKHRVFVPGSGLLKPETYKATYGGYNFAVASEGKPTRNAFEVLTESQLYNYPKAWDTCFRPEVPAGSMVLEEGQTLVNTYTPAQVESQPGDVSPFLDLLNRVLPDERDRTILLSYMAACVQYVGHKFQWAPVIQGTEGNGKSFFSLCVSKAVGERYSHFPNAFDLSGNGLKFTGWLFEKLFIGIEDMYPDGESTTVQEGLKDKITNLRVEMQPKGVGQFMGDNRANFMICSNHKDAILKTQSDRRYCVFFTAQQTAEDIVNYGMGGMYFPNLYAWARGGGYAHITDYLRNYAIPEEFNPAGACHRAPQTSSTYEAIGLSITPAEQEILEAVEEGRQGFRGGFISSVALTKLLDEKRRKVAINKREALLRGIGYVRKERMNNASFIDGGKKPIIYVTCRGEKSVELLNLPAGAATADAYTRAQHDGAASVGVAGGSV